MNFRDYLRKNSQWQTWSTTTKTSNSSKLREATRWPTLEVIQKMMNQCWASDNFYRLILIWSDQIRYNAVFSFFVISDSDLIFRKKLMISDWNLIKNLKNTIFMRGPLTFTYFINVIRVFEAIKRYTHFTSVYLCDVFEENVHRAQENCIYQRNKPRFSTSSDNHQIKRFKTSSDLILIWSDQSKSENLIWNLIWLPNTAENRWQPHKTHIIVTYQAEPKKICTFREKNQLFL